jgi:hypothetical protein
MIVALIEDTGRASRLLPNRKGSEADSPSVQCAIRGFARALFSEIEGTAFILADYLASRCGGEPPTTKLLQGRDEVVRGRIADIVDAFASEVGEARRWREQALGGMHFPRHAGSAIASHILHHSRASTRLRRTPRPFSRCAPGGMFRCMIASRSMPRNTHV